MSKNETTKAEAIGLDSIGISIAIYGGLLVIGWFYFECRGRNNSAAYAPRDRKAETRIHFVEKQYGFLGWLVPVWKVPDQDVIGKEPFRYHLVNHHAN